MGGGQGVWCRVEVGRGVRQGSPFSLVVFALVVEMVDVELQVARIGGTRWYADDLLVGGE